MKQNICEGKMEFKFSLGYHLLYLTIFSVDVWQMIELLEVLFQQRWILHLSLTMQNVAVRNLVCSSAERFHAVESYTMTESCSPIFIFTLLKVLEVNTC